MALERNYRLQIATEAAYGDGGTVFTDIPAFFDGLPEVTHAKHENPTYGGSLGRNKFFLGKSVTSVNLSFFLKGSGSAGTASELSKLLQILGVSETISAGVSVVYAPKNSTFASAGIKINLDGTEYWLKGSRAESLSIPLEAGNPVICKMGVKARYLAPTSVALGSPSFADSAVTPPVVESMAVTIGGNTHIIPRMTLELKNVVAEKDSLNAANRGLEEIVIVGREWGGSFMVEVDANNDLEYWTNLIAATEMAVASTGFGSAGNKIAISTSTLQLEDVKPAVLNGTRMYEVTFRINKHATLASEFSLTMT